MVYLSALTWTQTVVEILLEHAVGEPVLQQTLRSYFDFLPFAHQTVALGKCVRQLAQHLALVQPCT